MVGEGAWLLDGEGSACTKVCLLHARRDFPVRTAKLFRGTQYYVENESTSEKESESDDDSRGDHDGGAQAAATKAKRRRLARRAPTVSRFDFVEVSISSSLLSGEESEHLGPDSATQKNVSVVARVMQFFTNTSTMGDCSGGEFAFLLAFRKEKINPLLENCHGVDRLLPLHPNPSSRYTTGVSLARILLLPISAIRRKVIVVEAASKYDVFAKEWGRKVKTYFMLK